MISCKSLQPHFYIYIYTCICKGKSIRIGCKMPLGGQRKWANAINPGWSSWKCPSVKLEGSADTGHDLVDWWAHQPGVHHSQEWHHLGARPACAQQGQGIYMCVYIYIFIDNIDTFLQVAFEDLLSVARLYFHYLWIHIHTQINRKTYTYIVQVVTYIYIYIFIDIYIFSWGIIYTWFAFFYWFDLDFYIEFWEGVWIRIREELAQSIYIAPPQISTHIWDGQTFVQFLDFLGSEIRSRRTQLGLDATHKALLIIDQAGAHTAKVYKRIRDNWKATHNVELWAWLCWQRMDGYEIIPYVCLQFTIWTTVQHETYIWMIPQIWGTPIWMVYNLQWKTLLKWMIWGVYTFILMETPIYVCI